MESAVRFLHVGSQPRAPRIGQRIWNRHKHDILREYHDHGRQAMMDWMRVQKGFDATWPQYKYQIYIKWCSGTVEKETPVAAAQTVDVSTPSIVINNKAVAAIEAARNASHDHLPLEANQAGLSFSEDLDKAIQDVFEETASLDYAPEGRFKRRRTESADEADEFVNLSAKRRKDARDETTYSTYQSSQAVLSFIEDTGPCPSLDSQISTRSTKNFADRSLNHGYPTTSANHPFKNSDSVSGRSPCASDFESSDSEGTDRLEWLLTHIYRPPAVLSYSRDDAWRIKMAADAFFGLFYFEDAFELYKFLWKKFTLARDFQTITSAQEHRVMLACMRSAITDRHIDLVREAMVDNAVSHRNGVASYERPDKLYCGKSWMQSCSNRIQYSETHFRTGDRGRVIRKTWRWSVVQLLNLSRLPVSDWLRYEEIFEESQSTHVVLYLYLWQLGLEHRFDFLHALCGDAEIDTFLGFSIAELLSIISIIVAKRVDEDNTTDPMSLHDTTSTPWNLMERAADTASSMSNWSNEGITEEVVRTFMAQNTEPRAVPNDQRHSARAVARNRDFVQYAIAKALLYTPVPGILNDISTLNSQGTQDDLASIRPSSIASSRLWNPRIAGSLASSSISSFRRFAARIKRKDQEADRTSILTESSSWYRTSWVRLPGVASDTMSDLSETLSVMSLQRGQQDERPKSSDKLSDNSSLAAI